MKDKHEDERRVETSFELDAPVDAVWKALTDAEELSNWFPPYAEVKPGVGGHIRFVWDEKQDWTSAIGAWEPNKHLRVIALEATPPEKAEQAKKDGFYCPFPVAVDYYLEDHGNRTTLRLVHSGFSTDAAWDSQYDGTKRGWATELRGLKHYLEQHRGTKRVVVRATCKIADMSVADAWQRLTGPQALVAQGDLAGRGVGDRYAIGTSTGDRLEGEIRLSNPPNDLCATVENLNNALLRIRVDDGCLTAPESQVNLYLSTYGLPADQTDGLGQRWQTMLDEVFTTVAS
jgi:uncharacterized protein YndB with AHSA1/START domain